MGTNQNVILSNSQFESLFPFFVQFDNQFKISSIGPSLKKLTGDIVNENFNQIFTIERPFIENYTFDHLLNNLEVSYILRLTKTNQYFRGQFLKSTSENNQLYFLSTPNFMNVEELREKRFVLSDFSTLDPTFDLLHIIKNIEINNDEIKELLEKVNGKTKLLKESEKYYRTILNRASDLIYKIDKEGSFTYLNKAAEFFTGYTEEELLTMRFDQLVSPKLKDSLKRKFIVQSQRNIFSSYFEVEITCKSGEKKWLGQSVQYINKSGIEEFIVLGIDLTEKKIVETNLIETNKKLELLQALIDNSSDAIQVAIENGQLIYINKESSKRLGIPVESVSNYSVKDFEQKFENDSEWINHVEEVKRLGQLVIEGVNTNIHSKDEIPVEVKVSYVNIDNVGYIVANLRDVSERNEKEKELEIAKMNAEKSSKAKEVFLANMSHEIRTPLNAIIGMIRELSKEKLTEKQTYYLENTSLASQHLLTILNNVLDISKIESGEMKLDEQNFNLNHRIQQIYSIFKSRCDEKGIYFRINQITKGEKYLFGDFGILNQILINLVGNAVKFTEKGGIVLNYEVIDSDLLEKTLQITIADTGIGMDKKYLKQIFNQFSQEDSSVSRKYGGSGLGMSITYQLVKQLKGEIHVESRKNKGTTVLIELKFKKGKSKKNYNQNEIIDSFDKKQLYVLLVEDNEFNRTVATITLENNNCKVTQAFNGKEAIELLKNREVVFDVILMDIQMPVLDGIETTKIIRKEINPTIPIIALTANAFKSELDHCLKIGMNSYVVKPFEEEKLMMTIQQVLQKEEDLPKDIVETTCHSNGEELFSLTKLLALTEGDKEYAQKMIDIFILQSQNSNLEIIELLKQKDYSEISKVLHKIKPSVFNIGGETLRNLIVDIEKMTLELDIPDNFESIVQEFIILLDEVIEELKKNPIN